METTQDPLVGQLVDGRYRVDAFIARGGMATVYRAVDLRLERVVALKIMHRSLAEDPEFVERFVREARAAARLSHASVVAVYDQGAALGPDGAQIVYLAMEFVDGDNLRTVLNQRGRLDAATALSVLDPVLDALAAAHRAGIVHRDIKPENVLISGDGDVKVADFGLARAITASPYSAATSGILIGTVAYLSPEQVEQGRADARSDVYAAGVLLYELVVGQTPFAGETPLSIAYQHVHADVPVPSQIRPGIPAEIDELVRTAVRRDPAQRYPDATAFGLHVHMVRALVDPQSGATGQENRTVILDRGATMALAVATGVGTPTAPGAPSAPAPAGFPPPAAPLPRPPSDTAPVPLPAAAPAADDPGGPPSPAAPAPARRRSPRRRTVMALVVLLTLALVSGGTAWWWGATQYVQMPDVTGLAPSQASAKLKPLGLEATVSGEEYSESVDKGLVVATDPDPGGRARKQSTVDLVISRGPERHNVPAVAGMSVEQATAVLSEATLVVSGSQDGYDDRVATGLVAGTAPATGTPMKRDAAVTLIISKGPAPVAVPKVRGLSKAEAVKKLSKAGLKATTTEQYSETIDSGYTIGTNPGPGTMLHRTDTIQLTVSKGPPPVTVPDVTTLGRDDAVARLRAAGLKVAVVNRLPVVVFGRVYSQDPSGGSVVPKGSTVTITLV